VIRILPCELIASYQIFTEKKIALERPEGCRARKLFRIGSGICQASSATGAVLDSALTAIEGTP
jgi:hypothetical protein